MGDKMSEEVYVVDKTDWPEGEWMTEPDKVQWRTAAGLPGLVVRSEHYGSLCGYVGVPREHPRYGLSHWDEVMVDCTAHGGFPVNYSAECQSDGPVCHVPEPGQPADIWWFGFDCYHAFDFAPAVAARDAQNPDMPDWLHHRQDDYCFYRNLEYVQAEVEALALQLMAPVSRMIK